MIFLVCIVVTMAVAAITPKERRSVVGWLTFFVCILVLVLLGSASPEAAAYGGGEREFFVLFV